MRTALIIPAYNEAKRISRVLEPLTENPPLDEIIVVDDGSEDDTAAVADAFAGVRVIRLARNAGKGSAMRAGALATEAEVITFLDADLIGVRPEHVADLTNPVLEGDAQMTIGVFRGGRLVTDLSHLVAKHISGQRCLMRRDFLRAPGLEDSRWGVETTLTRYAAARGWRCATVPMHGITQTMKEEKVGFLLGFARRLRMYQDILRCWARPVGQPLSEAEATRTHPTL